LLTKINKCKIEIKAYTFTTTRNEELSSGCEQFKISNIKTLTRTGMTANSVLACRGLNKGEERKGKEKEGKRNGSKRDK